MEDVARLNISLPRPMLDRIGDVVAIGEHATPSEFIRDAVRHEFERRKERSERDQLMAHLQTAIDQGLESGEPIEVEDLKAWKQDRLARLNARTEGS